jgi:hypothetical protein
MPPRNGAAFFIYLKPHLKGGVLSMPKIQSKYRLVSARKPSGVGAEHRMLRPRVGVSCNLIYRTYKGSRND